MFMSPRQQSKFTKRRNRLCLKSKRTAAQKALQDHQSGKVKRAHAYTSHILTKKSTKRKRNLRKTAVADVTNQKQCKRLVPYK